VELVLGNCPDFIMDDNIIEIFFFDSSDLTRPVLLKVAAQFFEQNLFFLAEYCNILLQFRQKFGYSTYRRSFLIRCFVASSCDRIFLPIEEHA
jgi:hypothetical protein